MKIGHSEPPLHNFNTASLNVEPITSNRKSKDFLGFRIISTKDDTELNRFRASDIVTMRMFMASLGCEIDGLFSRTSGGMSFVEAMHGLWDIAHPAEDELFLCEQTLGVHTEVKELACDKMDLLADALPCYDTAAKHVPMGFYFHKPQPAHLGFEPGATMFNPSPPKPRRQWHDTFLPPWGPPAIVPVSIGHSAAIGPDWSARVLGSQQGDILLCGPYQ